ncbi:Uncharacterized protein TCM_034784 [Theobroma cacao]|uniref:Uncharacterized protein n=1 Tax=Theobroma cacao TaxID=3641 RepID=A0A061FMT8_THECC|nr:Uncharacterized protein TCM_034784 [Theobroma cacao]
MNNQILAQRDEAGSRRVDGLGNWPPIRICIGCLSPRRPVQDPQGRLPDLWRASLLRSKIAS